MNFTRRDWLRVASLGLAVGVAGCSSGSQESGGGDGGTGSTDATSTETQTTAEPTDETTTASADFGDSTDGETAEKGKNPAETEKKGTVDTAKMADGLAFVEHYHYSMNGVEGVAGTVKNEGDTDFETVTVHVVVDPGSAGPYSRPLRGSLPAGETQRFQFRFGDDAPESVESYTVWATGER